MIFLNHAKMAWNYDVCSTGTVPHSAEYLEKRLVGNRQKNLASK